MFTPEWIAASRRWLEPSEWHALADEFLFHDCDDDVRAWAHTTVRPMRTDAAMNEPLSAALTADSVCVISESDRTVNPAWQHRVWRERFASTPIVLSAGHCPHVSRPADVAQIINTTAADTNRPAAPRA